MSISNCGHDENNKYRGGEAGDQKGNEWEVIDWYNRPWKCVLRYPDAKVRKMIADMARAAAENDLIGYDQSQRYTFWEHLKASSYDPAKITVACEADCSSGVAAIVKGVGYRLEIQKLKDLSIYLYTGNLRAGLKAVGFEVLTESRYLTSDKYLLEGDIILNDSAHVATNLTNGSKAFGESTTKEYLPDSTGNYKVRIMVDVLNVRKGPGTNYGIATQVKRGEVYTIVAEEKNGSTAWGKLKSGDGYISLNYTESVERHNGSNGSTD